MRRKIKHQRCIAAQCFQIRQLVVLNPVDGLVRANVHIGALAAELPAGGVCQRGKARGLGIGRFMRGAVFGRLCVRFLAPAAGDDKVCRGTARQVQRHDGVFSQATTLHEQQLEMGWHGQQLAQVGFGLFVDLAELFATVAHLHHPHAAAVPVQHLGGGLGEHGFGHGGRAGRKVVRASHVENL